MLKTSYVQISEPLEPDTLPPDETSGRPNSGSDMELRKHLDLPGPELVTSDIFHTPDSILGQDSGFNPPTTISTLQVIQALQTYVT